VYFLDFKALFSPAYIFHLPRKSEIALFTHTVDVRLNTGFWGSASAVAHEFLPRYDEIPGAEDLLRGLGAEICTPVSVSFEIYALWIYTRKKTGPYVECLHRFNVGSAYDKHATSRHGRQSMCVRRLIERNWYVLSVYLPR